MFKSLIAKSLCNYLQPSAYNCTKKEIHHGCFSGNLPKLSENLAFLKVVPEVAQFVTIDTQRLSLLDVFRLNTLGCPQKNCCNWLLCCFYNNKPWQL